MRESQAQGFCFASGTSRSGLPLEGGGTALWGPARAERLLRGRRNSGTTDVCRSRRTEGCAACDDAPEGVQKPLNGVSAVLLTFKHNQHGQQLPQSASLTAPSRGSQRFEHYRRPGNQPATCQFSLTREERRGRSPLQIMTVRPSENVTMRIIPRKEGRGRPSPRATKTAPGHPGAENV